MARQWDKAIAAYSEVIMLKPKSWEVWYKRGVIHAQQAQWAKAATDLAKSLEFGSPFGQQGHLLALAGAGDAIGYRKACAEQLEKFGKTQDSNKANDIAWYCVRFPDAIIGFPTFGPLMTSPASAPPCS